MKFKLQNLCLPMLFLTFEKLLKVINIQPLNQDKHILIQVLVLALFSSPVNKIHKHVQEGEGGVSVPTVITIILQLFYPFSQKVENLPSSNQTQYLKQKP